MVLASKLLHFVSLTDSLIYNVRCKTIETSFLHVNNNSFTGLLIIGAFEKRAPGLKTGVENDIFWSEIGSGFGEQGGTCTLTKNSQEYPSGIKGNV